MLENQEMIFKMPKTIAKIPSFGPKPAPISNRFAENLEVTEFDEKLYFKEVSQT